jgi:Uma2 family endonuclease
VGPLRGADEGDVLLSAPARVQGHLSDRYSKRVRMQAAVESLIQQRRTRWTRARFDRVAELGGFEGEHLELVGGELVDMSPQGVPHAEFIERLNELLMPALVGRARVRIQLPFAVDDETEVIPDVAVVSRAVEKGDHPARAQLVIEVAESSERYDRVVKARLYAKAGVTEYWLLSVTRQTITVFSRPKDGLYTKEKKHASGELSVPGFADVKVSVDSLF